MVVLTKAILNQQIVSMRKEVKRAVVHLVHALTQNISKLKNKKGTDEQKEKNQLKADKLINEIQVLRKLKPDNVSIFALSHVDDASLNAMLAKEEIEIRSMVKLCRRENMRKVVNDFIFEYQDSMDTLTALISERVGKSEKPNKKKKKKPKKKKKMKKAQSKINSNVESGKVEQETDIADDTANSSGSVLELATGSSDSHSDNGFSDDESFEDEEEPSMSNDDLSTDGSEEGENFGNIKVPPDEINTNTGKRKLQKRTTERLTNSKGSVKKLNHSNNKFGKLSSKDEKPTRKNIDPFFENKYLTYCDIKVDVENDSKTFGDSDDRHLKSVSKRNDRVQSKNRFEDSNKYKKFDKSPFNKKFGVKDNPFKHKRSNSFPNSKPNKNFTPHGGGIGKWKQPFEKIVSPVKTEKLHPSWEAKKKLNQTVLAFQGSKITFDD